MDGELSPSPLAAKQQKTIRLDAFQARITKDNLKISTNGIVVSTEMKSRLLEPKQEHQMCVECGEDYVGEVCDSCTGGPVRRAASSITMQSGESKCIVCPLCSTIVFDERGARLCTSCKKFVHLECDRSDSGLEFVCASCNRSPLVGDVMLNALAPASPFGAESVSASGSAAAPSSAEQPGSSMNLFRSSSPASSSAIVAEFNTDIYTLSEDISSPATTSDSAHNSPGFYPDNSPSDIDDDFVPGRGGYSMRGSRGGKKKPNGRGAANLMKTRSGGKPPSGQFSDKLGQSMRGKRGKRGPNRANGLGKGGNKGVGRGRGRGRGANNINNLNNLYNGQQSFLQHIMAQQHQQHQQQQVLLPPMIREVDETMLAEEEERNTRNSDDAEYIRTIVICEATDVYLQKACLCLVCGSVGKGQENSMVACSNCAQTFHTYCVGLHDKLNQAVVYRGWRCLDCTVCEGCGEGKDESNLLLCEECDVSYHIYCLSPPLERIPNGPWRCQWCARCRRCNVRVSSGTELTREGLCTGCHSLRKCPKCTKLYQLGDKIIRCSSCTRWYHGTCEDLYNEEMLESASVNKMRCSACRPNNRIGSIMGPGDHSNLIVCDNVALNKVADEILSSKFMPGVFRPNPLDSFGYRSESFDHYQSFDDDYLQDELELLTSGTGRGRGMGRGGGPGRRVPKLGVGGFFVKIPRHRALTMDEEPLDEDGNKKQKRPRKPRRSQLEDAYPPQIQEGFFGMRPVEGKTLLDTVVDEPSLTEHRRGPIFQTGNGHELSHEATEFLKNDLTEKDILATVDLGNMDLEMDLDNMDFSTWQLDEDDEEDFGDSLNDAFDLIKTDTFGTDTTRNGLDQPGPSNAQPQQGYHHHLQHDGMNASSSVVHHGHPPHHVPPPPYMVPPASIQTLSRSSSQMDGSEKNNPTTERWEEDEPLGSQSTKAAVLYANEKHPDLKEKYPDWNDRVKHIQRLWRTLDSENRQEYVNRARENRANRGKQPRAKKIGSTQSTSVDSPTIQSPAPQFYGRPPNMMAQMDDRFKVPTMPPGGMMVHPGGGPQQPGGQMNLSREFIHPQQAPHPQYMQSPHAPMLHIKEEPGAPMVSIKTTHHLPQHVSDQYDLLVQRATDLEKHQNVLENELNRMRKQKKNLAAKKRQMVKSANNNAQPEAPAVTVDLNEVDRETLDKLMTLIPEKQKELEQCKQGKKTHGSNISEFEMKWNIVSRNVAPHDADAAARMAMAARAAGGGGPPGTAPPPGYHTHSGGPPPGIPHPLQQHGGMGQQMSQFHQTRVPPQIPYGAMVQQPDMHRPAMQIPMRRTFQRAPIMGGRVYDQLQTDIDRDVYDVMDEMLNMLSSQLDRGGMDNGYHSGMNTGMLKRLLEPPGLLGGVPLSQNNHMMDHEPPRPKKKRTQPKKVLATGGNEYDLMLQRVQTQLKLCEKLPKKALEPAARNPGAAFANMGISDLPDRSDKRALTGEGVGKMQLTFVDDYYKGDERGPKSAYATIPTMADLAPQAIPQHFASVEMQPVGELYRDADDEAYGLFDMMKMIWMAVDKSPPPEHIRLGCRMSEGKPPLEPHRSVYERRQVKQEVDEEVEVSVMIRDEPGCNNNMASLFEQLRNILGVERQIDYQLDTPPMSPEQPVACTSNDCRTREISGERSDCTASTSIVPSSSQSAIGGKCRACDRSMEAAMIRQTMSQLGLTPSDDEKDDSVCFCTMKCYYQFVAASKVALSPDQLTAAESHVDEDTLAKLRQISAESFAKCINQGKMELPTAPMIPEALLTSPRDTRYVMDEGRRDNIQVIRVSDLSTIQEVVHRREPGKPVGEEWQVYGKDLLSSFLKIQAVKQELAAGPKMGVSHAAIGLDRRICGMCGAVGDGESSITGRLLNVDANQWVHVNCAMWSPEVFENQSGGLVNVDRAIQRASGLVCNLCGRCGANMQCHKVDCRLSFHLPCAKRIGGRFVKDKTFFCPNHLDVSAEALVSQLDALRRIYVERDENTLLAKLFEVNDGSKLCLRLGALCFYRVGQLLPEQLKACHNTNFIFPIGFTVSRWFWSPTEPRNRMLVDCTIKEVNHAPKFVVSYEGKTLEGDTPTAAWRDILVGVERVRQQTDALRFFSNFVQGETLFGLSEAAITKITESLPGIDTLYTYTFRHPNSPLLDLPLAENPSGCARCEPRFRTLIKHKQRAVVMPAACSRKEPSCEGRTRGFARPGNSLSDELANAQLKAMMQASGIGNEWIALLGGRLEPITNNSQSYSLYQKMRKEWRQTVYLARSKIQGLGLYAKRDINMGDMIIEYKGEVIRSEVGEVREKRYTAQNRGVYMFRIDEELFVDATMAGGPARYINHSCDPNCATRILAAGPYAEDKKIIITANRPIKGGEELTYDYQFELEDTTEKIPCLCGAPNCNKWMN